MSIKEVLDQLNENINSKSIDANTIKNLILQHRDIIENTDRDYFYSRFGFMLAENLTDNYKERNVYQNLLEPYESINFKFLKYITDNNLISNKDIISIIYMLAVRNNSYLNSFIEDQIQKCINSETIDPHKNLNTLYNCLKDRKAEALFMKFLLKFNVKDFETIDNITSLISYLREIEIPRQDEFLEKILNCNAVYNIEPHEIILCCEYICSHTDDDDPKKKINDMISRIIDDYPGQKEKVPNKNHFDEEMLTYMLLENQLYNSFDGTELEKRVYKRIKKFDQENIYDESIIKVLQKPNLDKNYYHFYQGTNNNLVFRVLDSGNLDFINLLGDSHICCLGPVIKDETRDSCSVLIQKGLIDKAITIFNHPLFSLFSEEELSSLKENGGFEAKYNSLYYYQDTLTNIVVEAMVEETEEIIENIIKSLETLGLPKIEYISVDTVYYIDKFYREKYKNEMLEEKIERLYGVLKKNYEKHILNFIDYLASTNPEVKVINFQDINVFLNELLGFNVIKGKQKHLLPSSK